jgi:hypothetical protein
VSDTNISVSPIGLVTAKHAHTNSYVIAQLQDTVLNLTRVDTAFINVTTLAGPSAPLAAFSIQLPESDSNVVDVPGSLSGTLLHPVVTTKTIPVLAKDAAGDNIPTTLLLLHLVSSDLSRATVNSSPPTVKGVFPGVVMITASTTYYGVTKYDTLHLTIGYPDATMVGMRCADDSCSGTGVTFSPLSVTIGAGKTIIFGVGSVGHGFMLPLDVVFDDSTAAQPSVLDKTTAHASTGTGNVLLHLPSSAYTDLGGTLFLNSAVCNATPYPCAVMRAFPKVGEYHFRSALYGSQIGTITVVPNP